MAINDGDILSALKGIEINSTKVVNNTAILDNLQDIQQDVQLIRQISQGTQRAAQTAARNAAQAQAQGRARDTRKTETASSSYQYSSGNYNRTTTSNKFSRDKNGKGSFSSSSKSVVDDFLSSIGDGIQEELKKSLKESPFHRQLRTSLQNFAKEMGVNVSEIPSILGKDLGKTIIQRSGVGKRFASVLNNVEENIFNSVFGGTNANQAVSNFKSSFKQRYGRTAEQETQAAVDTASQSTSNTTSRTSGTSSEYITLLTSLDTNVAEILSILRTVHGIESARPDEVGPDRVGPDAETANASQGSNPPSPSNLVDEASPDAPQGGNRDSQGTLFGDMLDMFQNKAGGGNNFLSQGMDMLKNTKFGKSGFGGNLLSKAGNLFSKFGQGSSGGGFLSSLFGGGGSGGGFLSSLFGGGASAAGGAAAGGAGAAGAGSTAIATTGTTALGSTVGAGGAAAGGAGAAGLGALGGPYGILIAVAASIAIAKFTEALGPAIEGIKGFKKALDKAGNRYWESQKARLENEQKRVEEDIRTIAERPFKIMEAAAQEWYDAWDNNLKTITATQGYTKADAQILFESYARRLQSEGLDNVVSSADIVSSLEKVLSGGLSGAAAEEFAYIATILENAIPTQDFFSYSDTYAQVVANARARGLGESEAIQEADAQLQQFASNLLYANRNISGGLSSALKDGKKLWEDSVKIAATARISDSSNISGVLTSVAAQVGAIAPDLASDLVDKIVSAAIGGNSDQIVALRSIAGVGASNTEFLRILANDPKSLFATLFTNLAKMQQMNADNFMEVAEGLSETFGISSDAFARVDFQSLASAISAMQVNNASLSDNMALLHSGQTTLSDGQMRIQQINKMMLEDGLAYVLDNEAARAIQQHMWDQELANEMAEREYSVELAGEAKKALQGIAETVSNILNFLNPFSWVGKLFNMAATAAEYEAQKADIAQVIERGKVGRGNATAFSNLTNFSAPETVPQLIEMMGGFSAFGAANGFTNIVNSLTDPSGYGFTQMAGRSVRAASNALANTILKTTANKVVASKYEWGFVGKSIGNAIANSATAQVKAASKSTSSDLNLRKAEAEKINGILKTMDAAVGKMQEKPWEAEPKQQSFDEWWKSAVSKFSKKDNAEEEFTKAIERSGLSEEEIKGQYQAKQAQQASELSWKRDTDILKYVEETFPYWQNLILTELKSFHADMNTEWHAWRIDDWATNWVAGTWNTEWVAGAWQNTWLDNYWKSQWLEGAWQNTWLDNYWKAQWLAGAWKTWTDDTWKNKWVNIEWKKNWIETAWEKNWLGINSVKGDSTFGWNWHSFMDTIIDRYVNYTTYSSETKDAYKAIQSVKKNEKKRESGDAVLALAKSLTESNNKMVDGLKDPQVQTNALLGQILIVLEAILQAENTSGGATLATTLSALGLGLTSVDSKGKK